MKKTIEKVGLGVALGMGAGFLLAPKSGKEMRKELGEKAEEITCKMKEMTPTKMKKDFDKKIKEIEKEIKDLDKEKVLEEAEQKIKKISEKIEDLKEEMKDDEKTPIIDNLKNTMVETSKKLVTKLSK